MFIVCPSCSHRNDDSAAFCESCGQSLASQRKSSDVDKNLLEIAEEQPGGHIKTEECIAWFDEALDLLITLHSQNPPLIHGNIRPENIKLNKNGKLYLSGFVGQFELNDDSSEHKPDEATDIFCLGATFHYLFSGQYPHEPGTQELFLPLSKVISQYVENFPYEIQEILDRMLHPNRDLRYKSAQEVKKELAEYTEKNQHKTIRRGISFSDQPASGQLNGISRVYPRGGRRSLPPLPQDESAGESLPISPLPATEKLEPVKTTLPPPKPGTWDQLVLFLERAQEKPWFKIAAGGLIFLLILFWLTGLISPHWKYYSAVSHGERLLREGHFDLSVKAYRDALEIKPQNEEEIFEKISMVYTARGMNYINEGNPDLAQIQFDMIRKLGAGYPDIRHKYSSRLSQYSHQFFQSGQMEKALNIAESTLTLEPENLANQDFYDEVRQAIFHRGISSYNNEQYTEAIRDFNILLKGNRSAGYQKIYYWRGCAYIKQGKYLDGLDDLYLVKTLMGQKKLELSVEEIAALDGFFRYANSQLKSEHLARGARDLARKGMEAYEKPDYEEAVDYFEKFFRLMKREPRVRAKLGDYYDKNISEIKARLAGSYYQLAREIIKSREITPDEESRVRQMCNRSTELDSSEANRERCRELTETINKISTISALARKARLNFNQGRESYQKQDFQTAISSYEEFLDIIDSHPEKEAVRNLLEQSIISNIAKVRIEMARSCYNIASDLKNKAPNDPRAINQIRQLCEQSIAQDPSPENRQRCNQLLESLGIPGISDPQSPAPPPLP